MAGGLNKVMIIGNLGGDPEMRYTQRGTAVCNFSVAVNRPGRLDEGTGQRAADEVEWFKTEAWEKLAENVSQHCHKGSKVYVEGRLKTDKWQDQQGNDKYATKVVAHTVIFLDPSPNGVRAQGAPQQGAYQDESDEIPF